ncbi:MAG: hypothetical protein LBR52_05030 [Prevotellaceae bacterium]|jgi:hypothetical protein|nr:hypothetical protein [Prevotellaceae bacterium]
MEQFEQLNNGMEIKKCAGKKILKTFGKLALLCLCTIAAFSSCKRGLKADDILAIEDKAARDSMICYYLCGFYLNQPLEAADTFAIRKEPYTGKQKDFSEITVGDKTYSGEILVHKGDTLIPAEIFVYSTGAQYNFLYGHKQRDAEIISVKLKIIRDGKAAAEGWKTYNTFFVKEIAPFAWTAIFGDWDNWVISFIIFGGFLVLVHRLWLWIYRKVQKFRDARDATDSGLKLHFVFVGCCFLIAVMCVYLAFNTAVLSSLYFNPDIFAHWSEYPFVVKLFPFLILITAVSAAGMFIEMMKKMKSPWFIIHFIGWFALGCLIIGLTLLTSWLLYILILAALPFVFFLFKGGGGGSGTSMADQAYLSKEELKRKEEEFKKKERERLKEEYRKRYN